MQCPYCLTENEEGATKCAACSSWMVAKPPVREWTRSYEGKRLGGVCRGLADRFGVPVAALRLLFIGSILFGGWGVLAYLALWISLPLVGGPKPAEAVATPAPEPTPSPWREPPVPSVPVTRGEPVVPEAAMSP